MDYDRNIQCGRCYEVVPKAHCVRTPCKGSDPHIACWTCWARDPLRCAVCNKRGLDHVNALSASSYFGCSQRRCLRVVSTRAGIVDHERMGHAPQRHHQDRPRSPLRSVIVTDASRGRPRRRSGSPRPREHTPEDRDRRRPRSDSRHPKRVSSPSRKSDRRRTPERRPRSRSRSPRRHRSPAAAKTSSTASSVASTRRRSRSRSRERDRRRDRDDADAAAGRQQGTTSTHDRRDQYSRSAADHGQTAPPPPGGYYSYSDYYAHQQPTGDYAYGGAYHLPQHRPAYAPRGYYGSSSSGNGGRSGWR